MSADHAYLRFPTLHGDQVAFAAEDDVWLVGVHGGRAWRLTTDQAPVAGLRLAPGGGQVAFSSRRDGAPEAFVADLDGGGARRLTFWGEESTQVLGWLDAAHVVVATAAGAPERVLTWAWAVPVDGGAAHRLPHGPVTGFAPAPDGRLVLGVNQRRAAATWKRYRGGTAGQLWLAEQPEGDFQRLLSGLDGQLGDPTWAGGRLAFISDHEGWGNVYSVQVPGRAEAGELARPQDLRRHTDHGDRYARALSGDGHRLVYQCLGEVFVVEDLGADGQPRRLPVQLAGPRAGRRPAPVDAASALADLAPDHTGRASVLEVRGTLHWAPHLDGPVRALADAAGVRTRLPRVLPGAATQPGAAGDHEHQQVLRVTDADGDDALELGPADGSAPARRLAAGRLGRVLELAASPDGRLAAVATHDGRLLVVDLTAGQGPDQDAPVRVVVQDAVSDVSGLAFSPDSRWLAWSHPGPHLVRSIRMADLGAAQGPEPVQVTPPRFKDSDPVFTPDGLHLAFLSVRTFDPVYDAQVFDMSFLAAQRPYLLPLAADTPSPFDPVVPGRPAEAGPGPGAPAAQPATDPTAAPPPGAAQVRVDVEGLAERAVPVPVAAGRFHRLIAAPQALLWLELPLAGELGDARPAGEEPAAVLRRYDLTRRRVATLAEGVQDVWCSGDGRQLVVRDHEGVRVLPSDRRADPEQDADAVRRLDLGRVRLVMDPAAMWRQMYAEQGRLMRDHFWVPDLAGVDWDGVLARYGPLLDRIATRDDLSEVIWEVVGELGSSHAYETPPAGPPDPALRVGHLGAQLQRDPQGRWRVTGIAAGEPSLPAARSPLLAPGVGIGVGDALLAVDGRPVTSLAGPWPLLVGTADRPVELEVLAAGAAEGAAGRRVSVVPLPDERPLRYQEWVAGRRAATHAASAGRVGYLHVPDMMATGWAQLHRDLQTEMARDALVLDLRQNRGGHLSELVLEKLSRRVLARSVPRWAPEETWPGAAPRGPLVALANQWAGSDGDIGTAMFKALRLGPVVGTRTWGGVIGIDGRYTLVDGTSVTQPRYGFWMLAEGWAIENHGVDPDVEVPMPPHAWGRGQDPQLDTAVELALQALATFPALPVPDPATRPDRSAPDLPPRPLSPGRPAS